MSLRVKSTLPGSTLCSTMRAHARVSCASMDSTAEASSTWVEVVRLAKAEEVAERWATSDCVAAESGAKCRLFEVKRERRQMGEA